MLSWFTGALPFSLGFLRLLSLAGGNNISLVPSSSKIRVKRSPLAFSLCQANKPGEFAAPYRYRTFVATSLAFSTSFNDSSGDSIDKQDNSKEWEGCDDSDDIDINAYDPIINVKKSRRSFIHSLGSSFVGFVSSGPLCSLARNFHENASIKAEKNNGIKNIANAVGLVQFPCPEGTLLNTYHMMRAGESGLEERNILSTNPLFLTNREDALTNTGILQVEEACTQMMSKGVNPSVVKYSLASKCIDTANIVANKMMVGRNRIVPEFTFMDPRGAGLWDGKPLQSTEAAIWALDVAEAGGEGRGGKPPPNDDGTPNETLFEQVTRLRQLMSVLETQYSGDSILLIFPDGTSPALLSCLIAGIPLNKVHSLNYLPGEVRLNVNMERSVELLQERSSTEEYNEILSTGRDHLVSLRKEFFEETNSDNVAGTTLRNTPKSREEPINKQTEPQKKRSSIRENESWSVPGAPDFFSVSAMGVIGYMAMLKVDNERNSDDERSEMLNEPLPALAFVNATGASMSEHTFPDTLSGPNYSLVETFSSTDGLASQNIFEEVPILSKEERITAAENAMEDYLNQDDGGSAWLSAMKDIMDEEGIE